MFKFLKRATRHHKAPQGEGRRRHHEAEKRLKGSAGGDMASRVEW
ncbi:MAG: hypothetical protein Q6368_010800 [Candidatus Baldrarchaeota archaeon]